MATYEVRPASDDHDMRGNWETVGPSKTTGHTRKQAAINSARKRASDGDILIIKRTDGTIQDKRRIQSASSSSSSESNQGSGMPWGQQWATEHASRGTGIDFFDE